MAEFLNLTNYSYNLHGIIYTISGLLILGLGYFVFLQNPRSLINLGYSLMCLNFFVWVFFVGLMELSINSDLQLFYLRIAMSIGLVFFPVSIYFFSVGWLGDKRQRKFILLFFLLMTPFTILFWWPEILIKKIWLVGYYFNHPYYWGLKGDYFPLYLICWFIPLIFVAINIYKARNLKDLSFFEIKQKKIGPLVFIGYLGVVDYLPYFGIRTLAYGFIPVVIMILIMAFYGILRFQRLEIRLSLNQILIFLIALTLLFQVFLTVDSQIKKINLGIFLLFCFIGYFLIRANYNEVKQKKEIEKLTKELEETAKEKIKKLEEEKFSLEIRFRARTKELEEMTQFLEEKFKEKTKELQARVEELERFHRLTIGREMRMIDLKKEIEELRKELEKYKK